MTPPIDDAAFAALVAASGLPLDPTQVASLREGYALLAPLLERLHAPLPREAEPALTFTPEQA
jgi:hypothetical protein